MRPLLLQKVYADMVTLPSTEIQPSSPADQNQLVLVGGIFVLASILLSIFILSKITK